MVNSLTNKAFFLSLSNSSLQREHLYRYNLHNLRNGVRQSSVKNVKVAARTSQEYFSFRWVFYYTRAFKWLNRTLFCLIRVGQNWRLSIFYHLLRLFLSFVVLGQWCWLFSTVGDCVFVQTIIHLIKKTRNLSISIIKKLNRSDFVLLAEAVSFD